MNKDNDNEMPLRLLNDPNAKPSMYVNDISRLFMNRIRKASEREGVPHGYHRLLMELAREDGVTQLTLVRKTHLSAPTVSVSLAKMEADGLVRREADSGDMRQIKVLLTEKGREKDSLVRGAFTETDTVMMNGFSEEERGILTAMLRRMLGNLLEVETD